VRLHLQHGPIDLSIGVDSSRVLAREQALAAAQRCFETILERLVAPIEFTLRLADYAALGGHTERGRAVEEVLDGSVRRLSPRGAKP